MDSLATLVEVGKIVVSPVIAAITAIWVFNRKEREQIYCAVDWDWFASSPDPEVPFLAIQNRSSSQVMIKAFDYHVGLLRRAVPSKIAIFWEDPTDLNFPYPVNAGETRKFRLDDHEVKSLANGSGKLCRLAYSFFGWPRIRLSVTTMAGAKFSVSLERVVPRNG